MSKLNEVELRNLRERVKKLTAESKRWQQRAEEAEYLLDLADAQLSFLHKAMPAQVKWSMGCH